MPNLHDFFSQKRPLIWLFAFIIGVLGAIGAIIFRGLISFATWVWIDLLDPSSGGIITQAPLWLLVLGPTLGGLIVGLLLHFFIKENRTFGVADVIEARAFGGQTLELKSGLFSACISALALGFGASSGREGPLVHLGATLSRALSEVVKIAASDKRILLGCGVAAVISASFETPIAGILFAHEVILAHYALSAFVPIVLSSAIAVIITKILASDFHAFTIPAIQIESYWEIPAFLLLGIVCALVAIIFQFAIIGGDWISRRVSMPIWLRPTIGGFFVGLIAIFFPQVLGVGYDATSDALNDSLTLTLIISVLIAKIIATTITLSSRFGGGIVSPSLFIGAMTGGAFGLIASSVFPELSSSHSLYAILGMSALASAILGAPLSTTVMVFELTGGFALSFILLLTSAISTGLSQAVHGVSLFHWQLRMRGHFLDAGPYKHVVRHTYVETFMRRNQVGDTVVELDSSLLDEALIPFDNLETAFQTFDKFGVDRLPVLLNRDKLTIIGWVYHVDALEAYNKALVDLSIEEHR